MFSYDGNSGSTQPPDGVQPDYNQPVRVDLFQDGIDNVDGATMNVPPKQLADWVDWLRKRFSQPDGRLLISEDFTGLNLAALVGASGYSSPQFDGAGAGSAWAFADDSANGASGAVSFSHASTSAWPLLGPGTLALGQSDLWLSCRLRIPAIGGANSVVAFGFFDVLGAGANNVIQMVFNPTANGNSNWWLWYGQQAAPTKVDSGTARGTSSYQVIDAVRIANKLYVYINGALKIGPLSPAAFNINQVQAWIQGSAQTSGTTTAFVDYYNLWSKTSR